MSETKERQVISVNERKRKMKEKNKKRIKIGLLLLLLMSMIISTTACTQIFSMIAGKNSQLQAPEITSLANADGSSQVTMTNLNKSGEIYYTLDGAEPLTNSLFYENPFPIKQTTSLNVRVIDGNKLSPITSQHFNITQVTPTPEASADQAQTAPSIPSIKGLGVDPSHLFDVWASSTLSPIDGIYYHAANLTDHNNSTVWVEGASGNGYGETVTFSYKGSQPARIQGVEIINGYIKSNKTFAENGYVTQLGVYYNGQKIGSLNLSVTSSPQNFDLACTVSPGDVLVFEINGVQEGPNDGEYDTAMTRIAFY